MAQSIIIRDTKGANRPVSVLFDPDPSDVERRAREWLRLGDRGESAHWEWRDILSIEHPGQRSMSVASWKETAVTA